MRTFSGTIEHNGTRFFYNASSGDLKQNINVGWIYDDELAPVKIGTFFFDNLNALCYADAVKRIAHINGFNNDILYSETLNEYYTRMANI